MLHELRGRRTETRFPVSINPLTEITIFGGESVENREKSDTSASESQRGRRVICRKDRSWRVSVKGRAEGGKEMWRERSEGKKGGLVPVEENTARLVHRHRDEIHLL